MKEICFKSHNEELSDITLGSKESMDIYQILLDVDKELESSHIVFMPPPAMLEAAGRFLDAIARYIKNNNIENKFVVLDLKPHWVTCVAIMHSDYITMHSDYTTIHHYGNYPENTDEDIVKIISELLLFVPIWNADYSDTTGIFCLNVD